ncbi:hypothetical protein V1504DRAFT_434092 [Lipomyces starkeyi]
MSQWKTIKATRRMSIPEDFARAAKGGSEELPARSLSAPIAESGAASAAEAGDNLAKEFYLGSAVVEGVMDEWDHVDDSIRALDTINLIVQCTQVITGAVSVTLMVVGAEFSVLPEIGLLVAAAGVVQLMFVE